MYFRKNNKNYGLSDFPLTKRLEVLTDFGYESSSVVLFEGPNDLRLRTAERRLSLEGVKRVGNTVFGWR